MLNSLTTYEDAGRRSAKARRQKDEAQCRFIKDWYRRAKAMERREDQASVTEAFERGYREAATPTPVLLA